MLYILETFGMCSGFRGFDFQAKSLVNQGCGADVQRLFEGLQLFLGSLGQ